MDNSCAIKYGALPERLYVLRAGKVLYKVRNDGSPPPWSRDWCDHKGAWLPSGSVRASRGRHFSNNYQLLCFPPPQGAIGPWGYDPQEVRSYLEKIE